MPFDVSLGKAQREKYKLSSHAPTMLPNEPELFWDATYAVAIALRDRYPDVEPDSVGLEELARMVEELPNFVDDPALVNERILLDIQITWYEEATH